MNKSTAAISIIVAFVFGFAVSILLMHKPAIVQDNGRSLTAQEQTAINAQIDQYFAQHPELKKSANFAAPTTAPTTNKLGAVALSCNVFSDDPSNTQWLGLKDSTGRTWIWYSICGKPWKLFQIYTPETTAA